MGTFFKITLATAILLGGGLFTFKEDLPNIEPESNEVSQDYISTDKNMGLIQNKIGTYEGYTLFTPRHYTSTYLVDMNGYLVQEWSSDNRVEHAQLLENGLLLRGVETGTALYDGLAMIHERLELVDETGEIIWFFDYVSEKFVMYYDFLMMENGNILASVYNVIPRSIAVENGRDPSTLRTDVLADGIIEICPDYVNGGGKIVWEWNLFDHIVQDFKEDGANYGVISENSQLFDFNYFREGGGTKYARDWNHVSGLDYNENLDLIVFSAHINDEIIVIDHSTTTEEASSSIGGNYGVGGDILYRFGNPQAYDSGRYADKHFFAIHDPQWISDSEIMVMNNNYAGPHSSIEILTLPDTLEIGVESQIAVVYDDFFSRNMGGGQILSNGNMLISEAVTGTILEINADKEVVWEYISPVEKNGVMTQGQEIPSNSEGGDLHNEFFLAYRYGMDYSGLDNLDLTPSGAIEH